MLISGKYARFTLIEVLIAMIIMTMVAALLIGAFHTGLMSYRKTNDYEMLTTSLQGALLFLRSDIKRYVPIHDDAVCFTDTTMAFYTFSKDPQSHLELVTYKYTGRQLSRSTVSFQGRSIGDPGATPVSFSVLNGVEKWKFSFLNRTPLRNANASGTAPTPTAGTTSTPASVSATGTPEKITNPSLVCMSGQIVYKDRVRKLDSSLLFPTYAAPASGGNNNTSSNTDTDGGNATNSLGGGE